jgi:Secretion system C-terminal sorting domain
MKKNLLLLSIAFLFFALIYLSQKPKSFKIPAAPTNEMDAKLRKAWDLKRFADPNTGKIPEGIHTKEQWFAQQLTDNLGLNSVASDRNATWTPRGPYNVGGRTRALAIDVTNENRLMAGGVSGGVWLSEDAGQTWTRKTPLNAHPGCVSIAQDPRPGFTNTWYYLSGELTGTSASANGAFYLGDGMFKSINNGETWNAIGTTNNGSPQAFSTLWQSGYRVVVSPTTGDVYASTYNCIFRSNNGGTSWTEVLGSINNPLYSYYTDLSVTSTGVLYATFSSEGTKKGIYRSTNGTSWAKIIPTTFPSRYDRTAIGINPNNENELYFLSANTDTVGHYSNYIGSDEWQSLWKYKYISGDGTGAGGEWTNLSANLPDAGTEFDKFACQGGYDLLVKVQPTTGNVIVGGTNLWRSTDGFATANNTTKIGGYKIGTTLPFFEIYPNHHPDVHDVLFFPSNPNVMLSASDGGVHRTENCLAAFVNWSSLNRGYQTTQLYTAIIEHATAGDNTIIGGFQDNGNFFVNDQASNADWVQTVNGDGAFGAIPDGKPYYILSIQQGRVVKTALTNSGTVTNFQRIDPIGRTKRDYQFINPLALDPISQNKLYLPAGNKFYRQDDLDILPFNNEWDSISTGWVQFADTLTNDVFSAIAVSKLNPSHRVYLGTENNKIYRIDDATSANPTWTALTSPLPNAPNGDVNPNVNCIAVDPDDANKVYLVFSNYGIYSIFMSENAGLNWKKIAGNLEQNVLGSGNGSSIRWFNILSFPDGSRRYFVGTSVGLYTATILKEHTNTQAGTVWTPDGAAFMGSAVVTYIDSRSADGLVVVATHGHGMWSANFSAPVPIKTPTNNLTVKVFPNPSSDFVHFTNAGDGKVNIYDAAGKMVHQLFLSNGACRVDLRGLSSGVYYWKTANNSGKMVKN